MRTVSTPRPPAALLSLEVAAARLGISPRSLLKIVKAGRLKVVRVNTRILRVDEDELSRFVRGAAAKVR